jgi:molecular chaperone GrpE
MFKKSRPESEPEEPREDLDSPNTAEGGKSAPRPDTDRSPGSAGSERGSEKGGAGETEIETLQRERDEHLQNWKRATADYQNLRRRLQSDIDAAAQRSKQPLILDLLLVLDYLEMALKAPCTTPEGKNLSAGVELTRSVLLRTLERENVRAVPEGGLFDAGVHQAVERVETGAHEAGTILETLRRGYTCNGQVLRPAQVRVAVELPTDRNAGAETAATSEESAGRSSGATEN